MCRSPLRLALVKGRAGEGGEGKKDRSVLITSARASPMRCGPRRGTGEGTPEAQDVVPESRDVEQLTLEKERTVPSTWKGTHPVRGHRTTMRGKASQPTATIQTNGVSSAARRASLISTIPGTHRKKKEKCEAVGGDSHGPLRIGRPVGTKASERAGIRLAKGDTRDAGMVRCRKHRCEQGCHLEGRDPRKTKRSPSQRLRQGESVGRHREWDWGPASCQE